MSQTQAPTRKKRSPLLITGIILGALLVAFLLTASVLGDIFWYQQLGYLNVLTTQWLAVAVMFVLGFLGMAVPVFLAIHYTYKTRPVYARLNAQLDRYQEVIAPIRTFLTFAVPIVLGFFAGISVSASWQTVLLWLNRSASGQRDAEFNLDVSFYLFELPLYQGLVGYLSAVVMFTLIITAVTSYLYGGISFSGREIRISKATRILVASLAAVYLVLQAASLWLDQYRTVTSDSGTFTGASFTDVNAVIPGKSILAAIAALVAVLFVVAAVNGRWRLPLVGTALLLVSTLVIGVAYPWFVQRFQVEPDEKSLELAYIQRNIDATRDAYGLSDVVVEEYDATTDATPGALRNDAVTTANIRIMDPEIISPTFAQLQQIRQYYTFPKSLDVDRYTLDGVSVDTVSGIRDINIASQEGWYNQTLVYTHGYGVVAAYGNKRSTEGLPVFLESGIPSQGKLGAFEPRIYFGENSPRYSIVGGKNAKDIELDYPSGEEGANQTYTTFTGDGGPKLDNLFTKLVYAIKFQSEQIVLSDAVSDGSQILFDRDPATRVKKVAPYLTLDGDPYASVVDGRVVWMIDGYTTSENYPYSTISDMDELTVDADNPRTSSLPNNINYIRNSVKATVDAYDGSVTLYAWDTEDPILRAWQSVFPSTLKSVKEMSGDLLSHVRYPADMFKVQRALLGEYHVTEAGAFYSKEDAWRTPPDPVSGATTDALQPPYYLTLAPGTDAKPTYSIYSTYIPNAQGESTRNVLTGYLAADANAGNTDGKVSESYGTLKLLTLPKGESIPGPGQVQNSFTTDTEVSRLLNILRQGGETTVISGNLLTLPVGGGLLYVQPVYVKSNAETSYPILQKVLVSFGDKIAFEDTLDAALDSLFGGDSGANAGDTGTAPATDSTQSSSSSSSSSTDSSAATSNAASYQQALAAADQAMKDRSAALAKGDWAAYGEADARLVAAIEQAIKLAK